MENVFVFIEILFKMLLFKGGVLIYAEHCITLMCVVVHPKRFTIMCVCVCGGGGVSPQPPPVCSIHLDEPHTSYRWRGERVIEPIKWMGIVRRPWLTRASGENLARTPGVTPLIFTRSAMGFLMTTESQDLGLTSHPKDEFMWTRWTDLYNYERLFAWHTIKYKFVFKHTNLNRIWFVYK